MPKKTRAEREAIASTRIQNILHAQGVSNLRTLEHKIADAGPYGQRIDPHILTPVKRRLVDDGVVVQQTLDNAQWLNLFDEDPVRVATRLVELRAVWTAFTAPAVTRRTGQALEIAVYRALLGAPDTHVFGGFTDLDEHDDSTLYSKQELHTLNGKSLGNRALDFVAQIGGEFLGIEAKNIRPWLYPHDNEAREALQKALTLDVVPVLIARRIPYVTFRLLGTCGVLMHETYNQRMAQADEALASRARDKASLGYHDIRLGNAVDPRLQHFVSNTLPGLIPSARAKLEEFGDLLCDYAFGAKDYDEFAARVRRRQLAE